MCNGGVRFYPTLWVGFQLDEDNGDMTVEIHMVDNEGVEHIIPGTVVWED